MKEGREILALFALWRAFGKCCIVFNGIKYTNITRFSVYSAPGCRKSKVWRVDVTVIAPTNLTHLGGVGWSGKLSPAGMQKAPLSDTQM